MTERRRVDLCPTCGVKLSSDRVLAEAHGVACARRSGVDRAMPTNRFVEIVTTDIRWLRRAHSVAWANDTCETCGSHWPCRYGRIADAIEAIGTEVQRQTDINMKLLTSLKELLDAIDDRLDDLGPRLFKAYSDAFEAAAEAEGRAP